MLFLSEWSIQHETVVKEYQWSNEPVTLPEAPPHRLFSRKRKNWYGAVYSEPNMPAWPPPPLLLWVMQKTPGRITVMKLAPRPPDVRFCGIWSFRCDKWIRFNSAQSIDFNYDACSLVIDRNSGNHGQPSVICVQVIWSIRWCGIWAPWAIASESNNLEGGNSFRTKMEPADNVVYLLVLNDLLKAIHKKFSHNLHLEYISVLNVRLSLSMIFMTS